MLSVSMVNSMSTVPFAAEGLNVFVAVMPKDFPSALFISVPVTVYSFPGIRFLKETVSTSLVVAEHAEICSDVFESTSVVWISGTYTVWSTSLMSAWIAISFPAYFTVSKATIVTPAKTVVSTVNSIVSVPFAFVGLNVFEAERPKDLPVALL